jgi:hypothetical protein
MSQRGQTAEKVNKTRQVNALAARAGGWWPVRVIGDSAPWLRDLPS